MDKSVRTKGKGNGKRRKKRKKEERRKREQRPYYTSDSFFSSAFTFNYNNIYITTNTT